MSLSHKSVLRKVLQTDLHDLLHDLKQILEADYKILDTTGRQIFPDLQGPSKSLPEDTTPEFRRGVPIKIDSELVAYIVPGTKPDDHTALYHWLSRLIARFVRAACETEHLTERLSQGYDEINLLYDFTRLLQPDSDFASNAHDLLLATADLLEGRHLLLGLPTWDCFLASEFARNRTADGSAIPETLKSLMQGISSDVTAQLARQIDLESPRITGRVSHEGIMMGYVAVPVWIHSTVLGFVGLLMEPDYEPLHTTELRPLECLAKQLSHMATNLKLREELHIRIRDLEREIHQRQVTEKALCESNEQLQQAQKMEAMGILAGGVAHDFNNILSAVNGFAEILLRRLGNEGEHSNWAREIQKAAQRGGSLTSQLLAFSRKQVVEPKILDLNSIVSNTEKMLGRLIGEHIQLTTNLADDLGPLLADPIQMEQIVLNLALNARDAMASGGTLTITTQRFAKVGDLADVGDGLRDGPHTVLSVRDTGCGMDDSIRSKIFEPFFTTKGEGKGTGLGLATVYGIVKQWNGKITVSSEVGVGTLFTIYFPEASERVDKCEPESRKPLITDFAKTVLLVEDQDQVRLAVRQMLEDHGFRVLDAADSQEALATSRDWMSNIDLVVSDVLMPGLNGSTLCKRLASERPDTKILLMTGHSDGLIYGEGELDLSFPLIHKPFTSADLIAKIADILDERQAA